MELVRMSGKAVVLCVAATVLLAGCGLFDSSQKTGSDPDAVKRAEDPYHTDPRYADPQAYNPRVQDNKQPSLIGGIFGDDTNKDKAAPGPVSGGPGGAGVGVNSYLWRATLDTVSFMPLNSADPFGGTILTDWYSPPETPNERFKVNIFILGRELRADGVRASVFHQKRDASGQWADAAVDHATGTDLENAILTRARQLRLSSVSTAAK